MRVSVGLLLIAACGSSSPKPEAPATSDEGVHKVIVVHGRKSGHYDEVKQPDGSLKVTLDILENGRGPHVDAVMRLADDGTIATFDATGHHEMGNKSFEKFSILDGVATWESGEEHGRADFAQQFFNPLSETPTLQHIVTAALKAGGSVRLLPAGQAHVTQVAELTVSANGRSKKIVGYAVTGIDFRRAYTWFADDGTWFGSFSSWSSTVDDAWMPVIDQVVHEQERLDRELDQQTYTANAQKPPAAGLAFTHARVLDVEKGAFLDDQTVVIVGDSIKAVGPTAKTKVPDGAQVIDLAGQSLIPGMIDMHSHTNKTDAVLDIASGVTTVRDVGNDPEQLDAWKDAFDTGKAVGPRIVRMGFIEGRNEKAASSKITAETPEEAKAAVDYYAKRGWEGIKIYNSMKTELVPVLTAEAHKRGMLVTGHVPVHMVANEAVRAGYDGIEHINQVALNFFATHDTDTRTPLRFTLVGDKAPSLDLASQPVKDFIALLVEHHTVIDPTMIAFQDLYLGKPGEVVRGWDKYAARMPSQVQRYFLVNGLPGAETKRELYVQAWQKLLAMVKTFYEAKVHLVIGTDHIGGLAYDRELELFAEAGIPNAAVLKMATLDAARAMKLDGKLGSIAPGKVADMFVVAGDPVKSIADIANVKMTVSRGVLFSSDPLFQAVGTKPASEPMMGSGKK
ncbi:MAG TPA: amidohydrolase family protein [Kofleriaceae bacterium]|nr:amidohydrolase family protein [Kofleriaceae bacterium]